jgi:hypothetical protein
VVADRPSKADCLLNACEGLCAPQAKQSKGKGKAKAGSGAGGGPSTKAAAAGSSSHAAQGGSSDNEVDDDQTESVDAAHVNPFAALGTGEDAQKQVRDL